MTQRWIGTPQSVLRVAGRLDGTSVSEIRERLHVAITYGDGDLVLDVSDVEWLDVTGLGVIVAAHRRLRQRGRRLILRGCAPRMRRALAVTRLSRVMAIEREEATPSAA